MCHGGLTTLGPCRAECLIKRGGLTFTLLVVKLRGDPLPGACLGGGHLGNTGLSWGARTGALNGQLNNLNVIRRGNQQWQTERTVGVFWRGAC